MMITSMDGFSLSRCWLLKLLRALEDIFFQSRLGIFVTYSVTMMEITMKENFYPESIIVLKTAIYSINNYDT